MESKAVKDVAAERQRQIEGEGWTHNNDDKHDECQMAKAASCYARAWDNVVKCPDNWPWNEGWWKPKTYRQNLVRAAALLIAEIERLDRKDKP